MALSKGPFPDNSSCLFTMVNPQRIARMPYYYQENKSDMTHKCLVAVKHALRVGLFIGGAYFAKGKLEKLSDDMHAHNQRTSISQTMVPQDITAPADTLFHSVSHTSGHAVGHPQP